eukprot:6033986-Prymnesium_polylepis.1
MHRESWHAGRAGTRMHEVAIKGAIAAGPCGVVVRCVITALSWRGAESSDLNAACGRVPGGRGRVVMMW